MNKALLNLVIVSVLYSACADDKSTDKNSTTGADTTVTTTGAMPMMEPNLTTTPVATGAPVATAPGMNPPHGQPGHRCEIAVGAPLNSAPETPAPTAAPTPTLTPTPSIQPTQPAAAPNTAATVTPPGMNPPHGQPGHDCAIPVGAPLKK